MIIVNFTTLSPWSWELRQHQTSPWVLSLASTSITLSLLYNTLDTQCFYWLCDATTWRHSQHHGIYTTYTTLHLRVSTHFTISTLFTITILTTYTIAIVALIDLHLIHYLRHIHCLQYLYTTHYLLYARAREREIERVLGHRAECSWLGCWSLAR